MAEDTDLEALKERWAREHKLGKAKWLVNRRQAEALGECGLVEGRDFEIYPDYPGERSH